MESALLAPPRGAEPGRSGREARIHIPLSLALPAVAAALAVVAALTVALLMGPEGHVSLPQPPAAGQEGRPARTTTVAPGTTGSRGPSAARRAELDARFEAARVEHEGGQHAEAFMTLVALADEGHCDAARLALQLVHAGPQAYLTSFPATPAQLARWRGLAGCGSSKTPMR